MFSFILQTKGCNKKYIKETHYILRKATNLTYKNNNGNKNLAECNTNSFPQKTKIVLYRYVPENVIWTPLSITRGNKIY